jgi:hypothetical protein
MTPEREKVSDWHEGIAPAAVVYARHCAGCCAHIILDDGNVEQHHAEFCLAQAQDRGHADCLALTELLARMTQTQRAKLFKHYDLYAGSVYNRFPFLAKVNGR